MTRGNLKDLLGRTITGVVMKEAIDRGPPQSQVFLLFSDGTYTEFYSDSVIKPASLWRGDRESVQAYMATHKRIVFEAYE